MKKVPRYKESQSKDAAELAQRLAGEEAGAAALEYTMVLAFVVLPLIFLFDKLFDIISDYFGMIAYYVSWPFL